MHNITQKLSAYLRLARFDKPIGTFLLAWPAFISLILHAKGLPNMHLLIIFASGTIIMRACGCIINDLVDQKFDIYVLRTKNRPLAAQTVSQKEAIIFAAMLLLLALILALQLNTLTLILSIPAVLLTILYPFTKRFCPYPQLFLAVTFSWSVPMASASIINTINYQSILLHCAMASWIFAFDTQYALADLACDKKLPIYSSAKTLNSAAPKVILAAHILNIMLLIILGILAKFNYYFFIILSSTIILIYTQQRLTNTMCPQKCFKAFLQNNYLGALIFLSFFAAVNI